MENYQLAADTCERLAIQTDGLRLAADILRRMGNIEQTIEQSEAKLKLVRQWIEEGEAKIEEQKQLLAAFDKEAETAAARAAQIRKELGDVEALLPADPEAT